jgi:hypothetical protein
VMRGQLRYLVESGRGVRGDAGRGHLPRGAFRCEALYPCI